jgi:putative FmdB family regulatory protein
MPAYQYRCDKCGEAFERTETISEHETAKPQCPKCGSKRVCDIYEELSSMRGGCDAQGGSFADIED